MHVQAEQDERQPASPSAELKGRDGPRGQEPGAPKKYEGARVAVKGLGGRSRPRQGALGPG